MVYRIYQDGEQWVLWNRTTDEKTYFETEEEAQMDEKKQAYIEIVRAIARAYRDLAGQMAEVDGQWSALYSTIITDDDMPGGIVSDGTSQLSSFTTVIANFGTLVTAYDAGIDTNFERVA